MVRTRDYYYEKFWNIMKNEYNYILEPGEVIVQANASYPSYWFVSNKGRVFSVYNCELRILKPSYSKCGKEKANGEKSRKDYFYTYFDKEQNHLVHIRMHKLIAEHFLQREIQVLEERGEEWHLHHKVPLESFPEEKSQFANRVSNLQPIESKLHLSANVFSRGDGYFQKMFDKAEQAVPVLNCVLPINLTELMKDWLKAEPNQTAIVVVPNKESGNTIMFTETSKIVD